MSKFTNQIKESFQNTQNTQNIQNTQNTQNSNDKNNDINEETSLISGIPNIITYLSIGVTVIIAFFALAYASLLLFPGNPIGKLIMDLYRGLSYTKKAHKVKSAFKSKNKTKK